MKGLPFADLTSPSTSWMETPSEPPPILSLGHHLCRSKHHKPRNVSIKTKKPRYKKR